MLVFHIVGHPDDVRRIEEARRAAIEHEKNAAILTIVGPKAPPPSEAERKQYVSFMNEITPKTVGVAHVIVGQGFAASSQIANLTAVKNDPCNGALPTATRYSIAEAVDWLEEEGVGGEDARRLHALAAVALREADIQQSESASDKGQNDA